MGRGCRRDTMFSVGAQLIQLSLRSRKAPMVPLTRIFLCCCLPVSRNLHTTRLRTGGKGPLESWTLCDGSSEGVMGQSPYGGWGHFLGLVFLHGCSSQHGASTLSLQFYGQ